MKTKDENKILTGNKQTIKKSGAEKTKKTAGSAFVKTKNSFLTAPTKNLPSFYIKAENERIRRLKKKNRRRLTFYPTF